MHGFSCNLEQHKLLTLKTHKLKDFEKLTAWCIWSKNVSHSAYEKSEAKMTELTSNSSEDRKQFKCHFSQFSRYSSFF
jgi:hypothetical protein